MLKLNQNSVSCTFSLESKCSQLRLFQVKKKTGPSQLRMYHYDLQEMMNSHISINPYDRSDDTIHQVLSTLPPSFPKFFLSFKWMDQHMTNRDELIKPPKTILSNFGWTLGLLGFIAKVASPTWRTTTRRKSYHVQGTGCKSNKQHE